MESGFDVLHRFLTERNTLFVDGVAQFHDGMKPLPGHAASPSEHSLGIKQLGAVPMLFQNPPATLDGVVLAVIRWEIQELNRLLNLIDPFNHAVEELGAYTTAFWAVVHLDLNLRDSLPFLSRESLPPCLQRVHNKIAGFCRTAECDVQLADVFVKDPAGGVLALTSHVMVACLIVAARSAAPGKVAQLDRRLAIDAQSLGSTRLI